MHIARNGWRKSSATLIFVSRWCSVRCGITVRLDLVVESRGESRRIDLPPNLLARRVNLKQGLTTEHEKEPGTGQEAVRPHIQDGRRQA